MNFSVSWPLVVIVLLCVAATATSTSSPGEKKKTGGGGKGRARNENSDVDNCTPKPQQKTCYSEAVHKCGKDFKKKIIKLEKFAENKQLSKLPYKEKCLLRENFLNCVSLKQKKCKVHGRTKSHGRSKPKYRQELKEVALKLWSTRGCLLGIDY